jgi:Tol biopolymer transport system component/DNA-binding winged helix-turn-helix (wHTH) protein
MLPATHPHAVRFGTFEVNLATGELFKSGRKIEIERQPFLVLTALLQTPGELVTREQLRAALWPEGTFVDFDRGLNVAVKKLRDGLGDSSQSPRLIETLARRGYRFIAPVAGRIEVGPPPMAPPQDAYRKYRVWAGVAGIVATVVIVFAMYRTRLPASTDFAGQEFKPVPLTSYPGDERSPALSPDGNTVAFSWNGEKQNNQDIYLKVGDTEDPVRLTTDPAADIMPAWSPVGGDIAFVREQPVPTAPAAIFVIPAFGGRERRIAQLAPGECYKHSTLSWSPDGEWLAFDDKLASNGPFALFIVSVKTGEKRQLTAPAESEYGDVAPAFSPDARSVAFVRLKEYSAGDIFLAGVAGGQPRRLTHDVAGIFGVSWTSSGNELVVSSERTGDARLWRIPVSGGTPRPLAGITATDAPRSVSQRAHRLVFAKEISDQNVWRVGVSGPKMTRPPELVISSTRDDMNPQPSPDGRRIAFCSNRSGSLEIWTCDSDGSNSRQLTSMGRGTNAWATWSPDGRSIAFNSDTSGSWSIYIADTQGGRPRLLIENATSPAWSRDGAWIYYDSTRSGTGQIWKISPHGGTAIQVTTKGGIRPSVSAQKLIYYARGKEIWRVPAEGGEETQVVADVPDAWKGRYVAGAAGLYFLGRSQGRNVLNFFDFRTQRISSLMPVEKPWDVSALALSPDEHALLFDQVDQSGSDLMVVENFH